MKTWLLEGLEMGGGDKKENYRRFTHHAGLTVCVNIDEMNGLLTHYDTVLKKQYLRLGWM